MAETGEVVVKVRADVRGFVAALRPSHEVILKLAAAYGVSMVDIDRARQEFDEALERINATFENGDANGCTN